MPDDLSFETSVLNRVSLIDELRQDANKRAAAYAMCAADCIFFFNNFVWTHNPKLAADNLPAYIPFNLFKRQIELIHWLDDRIAGKEEGVVAKSRDVGWTWVAAGYAVHKWLFKPGFKTTFGSRVEKLVDQRGNPDAIFEKVRIILSRLPSWMMPMGWKESVHDNSLRIINPDNENTIIGEGGDQMGRGGRSTLYIVDEGAFIENPEGVDRAISANADCRIWASTSNGTGNLFYRKYARKGAQVFRYHWRDDPRKTDAWAKKKQAELKTNPGAWEAEYDINFDTSRSNICIPSAHVDAAKTLYKMIESGELPYDIPETGRGGFDVGAGKAESVLSPLFGIILEQPIAWTEVDNIHTTYEALDAALEIGLTHLGYDSVGVGNTVTSTLNHLPPKYDAISVKGINTGVPPEKVLMPDGRMAAEWFFNYKIQLWWRARDKFLASYEYLKFLRGEAGGVPHRIDDCIALCDDHDLGYQLSLPLWFRNEKGLLVLESKKQLASRGIESPDRAEAAIFNMASTGNFHYGSI